MKHIVVIFGFIVSFNNIVGMDAPVKKKWELYAQFENQKKIESAYFEKQNPDRLIICKSEEINRIDISTKNLVNLNDLTCSNDILVSRSSTSLSDLIDFQSFKKFTSACLVRNGQFLAWATDDATRKKGKTKAKYLITLENSLAERKIVPVSPNKSAMPAFDSQNKPNYLMFGSNGNLTPIHFDSQEELLSIFVGNQIGICKINPQPDHSREYIAKFQKENPITFVCFHPLRKIIASIAKVFDRDKYKSEISVFDIETQQQLFSLMLTKMAHSLCFNNNNYLGVVTDKSVEIIFLDQEKIKKRVNVSNNQNIIGSCFHPQENSIAILTTNIAGSELQLIGLDQNSFHTFHHDTITAPLQCFNKTGDYLVTIEKNNIHVYKQLPTQKL